MADIQGLTVKSYPNIVTDFIKAARNCYRMPRHKERLWELRALQLYSIVLLKTLVSSVLFAPL
jgi:hypothetical protein